jgi:hypothetical protein
VNVVKEPITRYLQTPLCNLLRTTHQPSLINERIGEVHDVFIHPVLLGEIDDTVFMLLREKAKEGDFESRFLGDSAPDQWRQLVVITNEDKFVCKSQRAEAGRKGDLRSFVYDAIVEFASGE